MLTASIKKNLKSILPKSIIEALISLRYIGKSLPNYQIYQSHVKGKNGIEIGGPSRLFRTVLPLYRVIGNLDGLNFSSSTVWEGNIETGRSFNYIGSRRGFQFISDATDLSAIEADSYDFLLSSNCLEHIANPLKALMEWKRVIKPGGSLILVLPNKLSNFDHNRPFTPFEHLLEDERNNTSEHDLTHLDEILALHDLTMDPPAGTIDEFKMRSLDNFNNRTLHHHIFDIDLMKKMLTHIGFDVIETSENNIDFFALAVKR